MSIKMLQKKNYVINTAFIKYLNKCKLTTNEFILFLYFLNSSTNDFMPSFICSETGLDEKDILKAFNGLETKGLIKLDTYKNKAGIIEEKVSLDPFYDNLEIFFDNNNAQTSNAKFYDKISSIIETKLSAEDELIISSWLEIGYEKNMVIDACKEAKYNGVINLRYIDKILYEWKKRGIKSAKEADTYIKENSDTQSLHLFEYDWLNEEK